MTPEKTGYLDVIGPQIGIESSTYEYVATEGITPSEDFMLGGVRHTRSVTRSNRR